MWNNSRMKTSKENIKKRQQNDWNNAINSHSLKIYGNKQIKSLKKLLKRRYPRKTGEQERQVYGESKAMNKIRQVLLKNNTIESRANIRT